ncbi:MAG: MBL fold metallo-hydrolase [Myxococcales bacterium]|nr:MBL fold metallo-hydrolase [Myxococcales bacterium]
MVRLAFLGAAETVTGSKYHVETTEARLLVDCGLFQGIKRLRLRNWDPPPIQVPKLDAVLLTHAHIDHSGYLPRLHMMGYRGKVYCTPGTRDLLQILLPDAGYLQEEEARHANLKGYSKHSPAEPLFTREDAERCLRQLVPVEYGKSFEPAAGVTASFSRAGHILGSACLKLEMDGTSIGFSGDVGRPSDPILLPPDPPPEADYLVVESTYGDRRHPTDNSLDDLCKVVKHVVEKRGSLVIPAFAVGRAQHLLHLLAELKASGRIPPLPVYLDSPMAIDATRIFFEHPEDCRLSESQCEAMRTGTLFSQTPQDSMALDASLEPAIIVSASGMATGGRVLHHLRRFLPDDRSSVLLVGYQAMGTRGRQLLEGSDELKIHGQYVPVKAQVTYIQSLSAHADYRELLDWLLAPFGPPNNSRRIPRRIFVTHGEPAASDSMRRRISEETRARGWTTEVSVPQDGEVQELI